MLLENSGFAHLKPTRADLVDGSCIVEDLLANSLPLDVLYILFKQKLAHFWIALCRGGPVFDHNVPLRQDTTEGNSHQDLVYVKFVKIILTFANRILPVSYLKSISVLFFNVKFSQKDEEAVKREVSGFGLGIFKSVGRIFEELLSLYQRRSSVVNHLTVVGLVRIFSVRIYRLFNLNIGLSHFFDLLLFVT